MNCDSFSKCDELWFRFRLICCGLTSYYLGIWVIRNTLCWLLNCVRWSVLWNELGTFACLIRITIGIVEETVRTKCEIRASVRVLVKCETLAVGKYRTENCCELPVAGEEYRIFVDILRDLLCTTVELIFWELPVLSSFMLCGF